MRKASNDARRDTRRGCIERDCRRTRIGVGMLWRLHAGRKRRRLIGIAIAAAPAAGCDTERRDDTELHQSHAADSDRWRPDTDRVVALCQANEAMSMTNR